MKEIKAFIQPHITGRVVMALHDLPHFPGLTIVEAHGQGRGRGAGGTFKLTEDEIFYHKSKLISIISTDELAPAIVRAIRAAAHTGQHGDGLIVVTDVAQAVRIRTGEQSDAAI